MLETHLTCKMHRSQEQSERKGVIFWVKTKDDNYNLTEVYPHA